MADEGRVFFGSLFENVPVHRIAPAPVTYCTGKLNSLGCPPSIGFSGLPSASASAGFAVVGANVRNQTTGTLLYSVGGRALVPFQGGVLCLASPVRRTPARSSGGVPPPTSNCSGAWRLDMNALSAGLAGGAPDPAASVFGLRRVWAGCAVVRVVRRVVLSGPISRHRGP